MDAELFDLSVEAANVVESEKGIGTLAEGVMHSAIKYYFQPDPQFHEVKIEGFVCDAVVDSLRFGTTLVEVQTANLRGLYRKLENYLGKGRGADVLCAEDAVRLARSPGRVTVVHPISVENRIVWVDPETGECVCGRCSRKGEIAARALWELYGIRKFVGTPGFTFVILWVSTEERKLLCGWSRDRKKGSRRIGLSPIALCGESVFRKRSDYLAMIPVELDDGFTSVQFAKATKLTQRRSGAALLCLMDIGVLRREKKGRGYVYFRVPDGEKEG